MEDRSPYGTGIRGRGALDDWTRGACLGLGRGVWGRGISCLSVALEKGCCIGRPVTEGVIGLLLLLLFLLFLLLHFVLWVVVEDDDGDGDGVWRGKVGFI